MAAETQVNSQNLGVDEEIDDYRITAVLGQGGFGITYKARDETLRRDVAIKEYLPQQFAYRDGSGQVRARSDGDTELFEWGLRRFVDEGRALAMFRHPNIASVIRFVQKNGTAYLVMEFEEGMDFERWLEGRGRPDEDLLVQGILLPLLDGLARVHDKGLLHRDIKPENIFIRQDGTPVLIDFGASRPHGPEAASKLTSIISAGYSPFEQYGSGDRQGPWSDLYALAGTIYRAVTGRPPVDAIARQQGQVLEPAVKAGAKAYSQRFLKVLDDALALDPDQRPQDARELISRLGGTPPAAPADPAATFVRPAGDLPRGAASKRTPWGMIGGLVVLLAAGAGGGYLWLQPGGAGPEEALEAAAETTAQPSADGSAAEPDQPGTATGGDADADASTPEPAGPGPAGSELADTDSAGTTPAEPGPAVPEPQPGESAGPALAEQAPVGDDAAASEADGLDEDRILSGLEVPPAIRSYRRDQLAGAMLQYTSIKTRFDDCRESGCGQLPQLLAELQAALQPQSWDRAEATGSITIQNPRRLDNADCPYLLDVVETVSYGGRSREQLRTYCTSNGFDRSLEQADEVS